VVFVSVVSASLLFSFFFPRKCSVVVFSNIVGVNVALLVFNAAGVSLSVVASAQVGVSIIQCQCSS
jgi:hypothetical protein